MRYIVMNPAESTYELMTADSMEELAEKLGCTDIEINGEYISHNSPRYQVLNLYNDTVVTDLR